MQRFILFLLFFYFVGLTIARAEWNFVNPKPTYNDLYSVHYVNQNTGWIVGKNGSIYKTTNAGVEWIAQTSGTNVDLNAVFFVDANLGFAVGGSNTGGDVILLKTTNGGASWVSKSSGATRGILDVYFVNENVGYIVGYSGAAYKTTNAGENWNSMVGLSSRMNGVFFTGSSNGHIIKNDGKYYRTTNGGSTWTESTIAGGLVLNDVYFVNGSNGYIVGNNGRAFKTTNGGVNWTEISSGLSGTLKSVVFKDVNNGFIVGLTGVRYKTTNGGTTWLNQSISGGPSLNSIFKLSDNELYIAGNNGYLLKTTNFGSNWAEISQYATKEDLNAAYFTSSNQGFISGFSCVLGKTTNGGNNWDTTYIYNSQELVAITFPSSNIGYALESSDEGKILKTTDGGSSWVPQSTNANEPLKDVYFQDNSTGWAVGSAGLLYKTTNGGTTWSKLNTGRDENYFGIHFINYQLGYAVGQLGSIIKTTNGGTTWTYSSTGSSDFHQSVFFTDQNTGYIAGTNGKIYKTTNGGSNWVSLTSGVTATLKDIYFVSSSTGFVVGANGTILKTNDAGNNWKKLTSPTTEEYNSVHFIDNNIGYIAGRKGIVLKTENGGEFQPKLVYPPDNGFIITNIPEFNWQSFSEAINYHIQISTSLNNFTNNIIFQKDDLTGTTYIPESNLLQVNNTYYWRIRIKLGDDDFTSWSDIWNFTIVPEPEVTLISPSNNSTNVSIIPLLEWEELLAASHFRIQVSTSQANFENNLVIDQNNISAYEYQVPEMTLERGQDYFWRGKAYLDGGDETEWSGIWKFTTLPEITPVLTSPSNNATNVSLIPVLQWQSVTDATNYELLVSDNSSFDEPLVIDLDNLTATQYSIAEETLDWNSTYYWQVRATAEGRPTNWSAVSNFTTQTMPVVSLIEPADEAIDIQLDPTFEWSAIQNVEFYEFRLAANSEDLENDPLIQFSNYNSTEYSLSLGTLYRGTTYYWQVRAKIYGVFVDWSDVNSFTTPDEIDVTLSSPANNAENVSVSVTFAWNQVQGATSYTIQISTDAGDFSNPVYAQSNIFTNLFSIPADVLVGLTTYHWRVRAIVQQVPTNWSPVWQFTTIDDIEYFLIYPENEASNIDTEPTFEVSEINNATKYIIQISESGDDFDNFIIHSNSNIPSNTYTLPEDILERENTYYWRSRVVINDYVSPWTDIWEFSTKSHIFVELISPEDATTGIDETEVLFQWENVDEATSYELQISTNPNNFVAGMVHSQNNLTINEYEMPSDVLQREVIYYWRVRAKIENYTSPWSNIYSFETRPHIHITLVAPEDGEEDVPVADVTFDWNSSQSSTYRLQYSTSINNFASNIIYQEFGLSQTEYILDGGLLERGQTYYWRVRAEEEGYESPWSDIFTFHTVPLPTVTLIAPENEAEGIPQTVVFQWSNIDDIEMYQLQISMDDVEFMDFIIFDQTNITENQYSPSLGTLDANTEYFWRVRARLDEEWTQWSSIWSFTTADNVFLTKNFPSGWNMFSLNLYPETTDLDELFGEAAQNIAIMKQGSKMWIPILDFNTIGDWDSHLGYQVYFSQSTEVIFFGLPITPEDVTLNISSGWSIIPYLKQDDMNIEDALVDLEEQIAIVKDNNGNIYVPSQNINQIGNMFSGQAYNIYLTSAAEFSYPPDGQLMIGNPYSDEHNYTPKYLKPSVTRTGSNSVILVSYDKQTEMNITDGCEIAIYNQNKQIIGSGRFYNGIAPVTIWGNNTMTEVIDGAEVDEKLSAKIYNNGILTDIVLNEVTNLLNGKVYEGLYYSDNAFMKTTIEIPNNNIYISISPNPVKEIAELYINLPSSNIVSAAIYNEAGKKLATIIDEQEIPAGGFNTKLNMWNYTQGTYFINVTIGNSIETLKINLLK